MRYIKSEQFVDLSKMCTIRIGGKAKRVYFPDSPEKIKILLSESLERNKRFFPVGIGSNTVFSDGVLDHIFVSTKELKKLSIKNEGDLFYIEAEAGVSFKSIVSIVKKYNLEGFENLSGIPATVGGATVMNAGAFGTEISDIIEKVHWISDRGEYCILERQDIDFSYRKSPFQKKGFVYKVVLRLKKSQKDIPSIIKKHLEERNKKQPLDYPTSGSTFKNPREYPAGYLLEQAGLKGYRIGNVAFSEKHANFLINTGGGKFKELKKLIETAERKIGVLYRIKLEREIEIVE
ncbi:UDP-N-acetylmuramate dehydrogenase [Persephonella hydrogeniphila]|uniref:UDP-N-acetylenolpyruvoylglucosamine reductase n=1 Tax=Persephonella hydrogeniphila TaxID=198703 RepID=A0A285MYR8_9AQUI|nr:UDP-N-acetylmuramate dehydrogenase [Persephonella hydrogeniphila]SNZ02349.1 UDP-N-acetylmuramate dehydrogenase [Persephonella hydrogeniphila]